MFGERVMELNLKRNLVVLIIFLLVSSAFAVFRVSAVQPDMVVDPPNITFTTDNVYPGYLFWVTIWIHNSPPIAAWQVCLEFNDTFLQCTRWIEPTSDSQYFFYGSSTSANPTPPNPGYVHISLGRGRILVASNLFPTPPAQPPRSGSGKLCMLEFNITALPPNWNSVWSSLKINLSDTILLDPIAQEVEDLIKQDGSCTIMWVAPPSPHVGLNPELKEFAGGQSYDQRILVGAVSWRWFLNQTSFDLVYNASVIDVIGGSSDVTVDSMWGASSVICSAGRITVYATRPAWNPLGNVLVATVNFTVVNQPTIPPEPPGSYVSSDLTLENVYCYDNTATLIPMDASETGLVKVYAVTVYTLDISATAGGSTSPSVGTHLFGGHVSVQADPDSGYVFEYWRLDGRDVGWYNPLDITMDMNHTLLAMFGLPRSEGDINGDGKVDVKDVYAVAKAYGSYPYHPYWNSLCDINHDGKVDERDYYIVCKNYGKP
jgi:hypothetical protein